MKTIKITIEYAIIAIIAISIAYMPIFYAHSSVPQQNGSTSGLVRLILGR